MKGWVYAPFRVQRMVGIAISDIKGADRMRVVDVTDARHVVLYEDAGIGTVNTFTHSLPMSVYGRRWRFDFYSGPLDAAAPQLLALNKFWQRAWGSPLLFGLVWMW